jgi:ABC-type xylose transport system permease subunit
MKTLPVIAAFSHAIRSTNNNLSFAFRATWPWMLALLPVNIVGNLYILANSFGNPGEVNPKVLIPTFIMAIAGMVAFASIAVSWHRYILRDEIPRGMQRLRLDGTSGAMSATSF